MSNPTNSMKDQGDNDLGSPSTPTATLVVSPAMVTFDNLPPPLLPEDLLEAQHIISPNQTSNGTAAVVGPASGEEDSSLPVAVGTPLPDTKTSQQSRKKRLLFLGLLVVGLVVASGVTAGAIFQLAVDNNETSDTINDSSIADEQAAAFDESLDDDDQGKVPTLGLTGSPIDAFPTSAPTSGPTPSPSAFPTSSSKPTSWPTPSPSAPPTASPTSNGPATGAGPWYSY